MRHTCRPPNRVPHARSIDSSEPAFRGEVHCQPVSTCPTRVYRSGQSPPPPDSSRIRHPQSATQSALAWATRPPCAMNARIHRFTETRSRNTERSKRPEEPTKTQPLVPCQSKAPPSPSRTCAQRPRCGAEPAGVRGAELWRRDYVGKRRTFRINRSSAKLAALSRVCLSAVASHVTGSPLAAVPACCVASSYKVRLRKHGDTVRGYRRNHRSAGRATIARTA